DIIIDGHKGEVTIDGPTSKEQASAQDIVAVTALNSLHRYLKVKAALAQSPNDRKLKTELKKLKKYKDFLDKFGARNIRREPAKQARRGLQSDLLGPTHDSDGDEDGT